MTKSASLDGPAQKLLATGQAFCFQEPPNLQAAVDTFRELLYLEPASGEASLWLGYVLERQNKVQEAAQAFPDAIRLLLRDPRPMIALGRCELLAGNYESALLHVQEGLRLKPGYAEADAKLLLAEAYERLGQIRAAIACWKEILQMEASYPSHDAPHREAKEKLSLYGGSF